MKLKTPSERTDKINKLGFLIENRRYLVTGCDYHDMTLGRNFVADWWTMNRLHDGDNLAPSKHTPPPKVFEIWEC